MRAAASICLVVWASAATAQDGPIIILNSLPECWPGTHDQSVLCLSIRDDQQPLTEAERQERATEAAALCRERQADTPSEDDVLDILLTTPMSAVDCENAAVSDATGTEWRRP